MNLPGHIRPGEPLSAAWGNDVVDALRSLVPRDSRDIRARTSTAGTTFELARAWPAPARRVAADFELVDASTVEDGWQLSIVPGTVLVIDEGSLTPTLGGDPLTDDPRPVAAVGFAAVKVYLHVETDNDEAFVALTVELVDAGAAQPVDDFWNGYLLLGTATQAGDEDEPSLTFVQSVTGDKAYRKVNITHLWGAL